MLLWKAFVVCSFIRTYIGDNSDELMLMPMITIHFGLFASNGAFNQIANAFFRRKNFDFGLLKGRKSESDRVSEGKIERENFPSCMYGKINRFESIHTSSVFIEYYVFCKRAV